MARFTLNCAEAVRLLSDAMDRPLPLGERLGLRLHLLICRWCDRYGRQLRFIREALRRRADASLAAGDGLAPEAKERLRRVLADARNEPPPSASPRTLP